MTLIVSGQSATVTVTEQQTVSLSNAVTGKARVEILTGPRAGRVVADNHRGRASYGPFGAGTISVAAISGDLEYTLSGSADFDGPVTQLTAAQVAAVAASLASLQRPSSIAPFPLRKTQRALARVRSGVANATICCVGDSVTAGQYADGVNAWTGNKALSYPTALAAILTRHGAAGSIASVTSDNSALGHAGTIPSYDPRVVSGANYTTGALDTAGGQVIYNVAGTLGSAEAETFTFTPGTSFDTVEIYWYRSASVGTMTVDCGGAVLTTLSSSGAVGGTTTPGTVNQLNKTIVTKAAGADPINIIRTVLGTTIIAGVVAYLSTAKCVNVLNMGWSGARTSSWNNTTGDYAPLNALLDYAADLTIICLGINDAIVGVSQATFTSNMAAIVTAALTTGDVLLVYPPLVDTTIASAAAQSTIYAAITAVAAAKSVPVLDLQARWSSYSVASGLGYMHTDKTHPVAIGYQDIASAISSVILAN